jgi:hypothetical protein
MTAFGADVPIAISRMHRPEVIAFYAIGTAHDFLNHCQHFASSASVTVLQVPLLDHVLNCWAAATVNLDSITRLTR